MTKEELDRIKEAYYSGLKVQIWFGGHWENFDARDYSMYSDPFSEHRQYRIVGSAYVDIAEKQIADLKKENATLKKQLEALSGDIPWNELKDVSEVTKELTEAKEQLTQAKDIINCLVHLGEFNENTDEEYLNYQVHDVLKQAENFLSEVEK